jgi:hydrogenase-4 component E
VNPSPQIAEFGVRLIPLLAAMMLVSQLLLLAQRMLVTVIRVFAVQSLLLAAIAGVVGYTYHAGHVLLVAVLTVAGKVLFLPWLLGRLIRRMSIEQEISPWMNVPASLFLCGGLTFLGYLVARPFTSLERLGGNTLAVAVALVLTGFFLLLNRRKAVTQVLALMTMENGVMLAAIAFSSYGMPLVVELGIFSDVVVAVMVLGLLVFRIRETFASMDTSRLNELRG